MTGEQPGWERDSVSLSLGHFVNTSLGQVRLTFDMGQLTADIEEGRGYGNTGGTYVSV